MTTPSLKLNPSAPLESKNDDFEQRLEKQIDDENSFDISINYIKEIIIYLKDKNYKSKTTYTNYETLTSIIESLGVGLFVVPISPGIACAISLAKKVSHKILNKYNKYKKQYQKDQQTIKSFENLDRKGLQDNLIDKNEYEYLCSFF